MQTLTEVIWKLNPPGGLFDKTVVANCFPAETAAAHRNLVYRAKEAGEISIIRRGLYFLEKPYRREGTDPIVIAPLIYGPSYVSFESALRFHGLIPDIVQNTSAATSRRSRVFETSAGFFDFTTVPCAFFLAGVRSVSFTIDSRPIMGLVASPARAIADLVYVRREVSWDVDGVNFLGESLRIDLDDLADALFFDELNEVKVAFHNRRVCAYLDGIQHLLASSRNTQKGNVK